LQPMGQVLGGLGIECSAGSDDPGGEQCSHKIDEAAPANAIGGKPPMVVN